MMQIDFSVLGIRRRAATAGLCLVLLGSSVISAVGGSAQVAGAAGNPCASLTPVAIRQVIDTINRAHASATLDANANGTTGAYASAARDSLMYVTQARDKMVDLQTWLRTNNLDNPYVSNISAAYNVHGYVRETEVPLLYGQHWAMISAEYHNSAAAKKTFEETATASEQALALGAQGGRCHLSPPVFP
jgi:hypothetical protein